MSGIYIPGMEMPTACYDCPLCYDLICCLLIKNSDSDTFDPCSGRLPNCPLIPVPNHGRLVDADALTKEFPTPAEWREVDGVLFHITGILAKIKAAPTIIPADKDASMQSNTSNALDALGEGSDTT